MTSRHGVHVTVQTAFRIPEGLLASLKDAAGQDERTVTDCVNEAIAEWLDRRRARLAPPRSVSRP
jgi:phage-related baseplate assembly protein